jgi:branched-chain amino acid transport system permease protein
MGLLAQAIAGGIVTGAIYALVALSLVIIHKSTDVINFAGGDVLMVGCYIALMLLVGGGAPYWVAGLVAVLGAAAIGAGFDRLVLARIARNTRGQDILVAMVTATIGLSYVLKGVVRALGYSDEVRSLPAQFQGPPLFLGDVILLRQDIGILATAALAGLGLFLFFRFTRLGKALRAVAEDPRAAALIGIPVRRMRMIIWAIACAVAALGGLLVAPKILMTPDMGGIVILGFAAAVVGGFSSIPGLVVGGILLGVVENMVGLFVSAEAIAVAPFLVIMAVLVLRPQGLFGGRVAAKKV